MNTTKRIVTVTSSDTHIILESRGQLKVIERNSGEVEKQLLAAVEGIMKPAAPAESRITAAATAAATVHPQGPPAPAAPEEA